MRTAFITYCLLIAVVDVKSQPPLNQWYNLGGAQSVINSIHPTDSCYYFTGIVHDGVAPISWNLVFGKMDFDGNILQQTNYYSDTIGMIGVNNMGSTLLATLDGNFVTLADYGDVFLFMKFSPSGDTLFSRFFDQYLVQDNFKSLGGSGIIQNSIDSSFVCVLSMQHDVSLECRSGMVILDKNGVILYYNSYPINQALFQYTWAKSVVQTTDGYLVSSYIVRPTGSNSWDYRARTRLIKTDFSGNELWRWTDWDCEADEYPGGLTQTPDGGYLYAGISGQYHLEVNGQQYAASVTKLDASLNKEWKIAIGDSTSNGWINMTDITFVEENNYVACGFWYAGDSAVIGSMINFNLQGQVLWDSYFTFIPALDQLSYPWHELYEIDLTPDGGFVMVGVAQDWIALKNNIPGSFGWVVKTDSVGCLVPGCQDFFGVDEIDKPTVQLSLYPNPTSNFLNIYFNDPAFSGNALMQIYDIQGKLIREWQVTMNDITFMYDVSLLHSGTYILKVTSENTEISTQKFIVD